MDLTQAMVALLNRALADGFGLPLHVAAVATNGEAFVATYTEGDDGLGIEFKLEAEGNLQLPINLMLVGGTGKAGRAVIEPGGARLVN